MQSRESVVLGSVSVVAGFGGHGGRRAGCRFVLGGLRRPRLRAVGLRWRRRRLRRSATAVPPCRVRGRRAARPAWRACGTCRRRRPGGRRAGPQGCARSPGSVHSGAPRLGTGGSPDRSESTDEIPCRGGRLVVEELPVDHHDGRVVACGVALDVFEGDPAVVGGLAGVHTQVVLQRVEDGVAAHDRAQRVRADADQILAGGGAPVHRVERGDRGHLGLGQVELGGAERDARLGEIAVFGLHQVQQRQQRRPRPRVAGDDVAGTRPPGALSRRPGRPSPGDRRAGFVGPLTQLDEHR